MSYLTRRSLPSLTNAFYSLLDITHSDTVEDENAIHNTLGQRQNSPTSIAKPVRPIELSLWMAVPFVTLFLALAVALGVIFDKAYANGTHCLSFLAATAYMS